MKTRSRILKSDKLPFDRHYRIPGISGPIYEPLRSQGTYEFQSWQQTSSEGHLVSRMKQGEDVGGPFITKKWEHVESTPTRVNLVYGNSSISNHYIGPVLAKFAGLTAANVASAASNFPANVSDTPVSTLDGLGTIAIANTIPTNPVADTAQFIGELREGLPSIPGRALLKAKLNPTELGGEYLNYAFGIKPIISDFKKYAKAIRESEKILRQLERDSGKNVRRRYDFSTRKDSSTSIQSGTYAVIGGTNSSGPSDMITTTEETVDYWFEGAYTYYLPPQGTFARYLAEANKLYGLRPSVSTLYELSPWSWAADWFGSTGDVLHNLSAFQNDSLVLRYGYLMEHRVRTVTYSIDARYETVNGPVVVPAKQTFRFESKRRVPATPYGFGLTFDGFSPSQLAVIAALGLSKASSK